MCVFAVISQIEINPIRIRDTTAERGEQMRQYLKKLRADKEATQDDVANALGISQNYYSLIENGLRKDSLDLRFLIKLSEYFGVSLKWITEEEKKLIGKKGA